MPNLKTTLGKIKSFHPCADGWKKLCKNIGTTDENYEVLLLQILDSNGAEDAFWSLCCWDYRDYCLLLADVIEPVLTLSECDKVKKMSDTIRRWHAGLLTYDELAAAWAAAEAAAGAAAWVAAMAAARAARAAARAAAWDATEAAWAAAWDAAGAAAMAAAWDARDAAWAAAEAARDAAWAAAWDRNEKLVRAFITKGDR